MSAIAMALFVQIAAACPLSPPEQQRAKAYAMAESAFNPLAIHDNTTGVTYQPTDQATAATTARRLVSAGHSIDAGIMQIDVSNWPRFHLTPETVFDLKANICAGGEILQEDRRVACLYNSGHPDCSNGYPERIEQAARTIRATDTEPAPQPELSSPPCAPAWDAWALAACSKLLQASAHQSTSQEPIHAN